MKYSIIIPIYNESLNIIPVFERIDKVLKSTNESFEIIYINDGSKDNSIDIIKNISQHNTQIKYINFSRNFGHQIAVSAGIDFASGDEIILIDADGQDPPEIILDLIQKINEGYHVVYAKRKTRKGENAVKLKTAKWFYRILDKITTISIPLDTGDFRIFKKIVAEQLKNMPEKQKFLRGQIAWSGFKQTYIEYDRDIRIAGHTQYTFRKMLKLALDGITGFSNFPLKLATISGFVCALIGLFLIFYTLYSRFILKDYEPGWSSLMITIVFIGGIQLIGIGIIGEYISRIYDNVRNRPLYIIEDSNIKTKIL